MEFRRILLFWFSSILLTLSSYGYEYCTEVYDPDSCMYNFFCDRVLRSRKSWNSYTAPLPLPQYGGHRIQPIHLTITDFETDSDNLVPVFYDSGYNGNSELAKFVVVLDLSGNPLHAIQSMPYIKNQMSNLITLKISNAGLTLAKLSNKYELPTLEELDLSSNIITEVDVDGNEHPFRKLKKINLSENNLESVPNLELFRELEDIDFSHNNIEVLEPIYFDGIKKLISLNISHNRISDINSSLFRFTKLKVLNLKFNKIDHIITNDFEKLTMLENLDLSSNLISSLDKDIFKSLISLKELNVRDNKIVLIDKETFTRTPNLKFVDLSANELKSLPKDLFRDKNLQNFSVEGNSLEGSLMRGMFDGLTYVSNLDLSYQLLDTVEDYAFYGLRDLKILTLHHNNIKNLTLKCFETLKNLKELD